MIDAPNIDLDTEGTIAGQVAALASAVEAPIRPPFSLQPHQVPAPPHPNDLRDVTRWLLMVMDCDDQSMPFVASVFAYGYAHGGLTPKQSIAIDRVFDRVQNAWVHGLLECQEGHVPPNAGGDDA